MELINLLLLVISRSMHISHRTPSAYTVLSASYISIQLDKKRINELNKETQGVREQLGAKCH